MGTTGHSKYQIKQIEKASTFIPILLTSNTSLGIAFIKNLLTLSSGMLARFETKRISIQIK